VRQAVREHRDWLADSVRTAFAAIGHPDPALAARHWVVLRDGAMVGGYLTDPAQAQAVAGRGRPRPAGPSAGLADRLNATA